MSRRTKTKKKTSKAVFFSKQKNSDIIIIEDSPVQQKSRKRKKPISSKEQKKTKKTKEKKKKHTKKTKKKKPKLGNKNNQRVESLKLKKLRRLNQPKKEKEKNKTIKTPHISGLKRRTRITQGQIIGLNSTPKKLIIKGLSFQRNPIVDKETIKENTWKRLSKAVKEIQNNEKLLSFSCEELYKTVENLCNNNYSKEIYEKLTKQISLHLASRFQRIRDQTKNSRELNLLELVVQLWKSHTNSMFLIKQVFLFLNQTYVLQRLPIGSLTNMSLVLFRDSLTCKNNNNNNNKNNNNNNNNNHQRGTANENEKENHDLQDIEIEIDKEIVNEIEKENLFFHNGLLDNQKLNNTKKTKESTSNNKKIKENNLLDPLIQSILIFIQRIRFKQENLDMDLFKHGLEILSDCKLFFKEFQPKFFEETRQFYKRQGGKVLEKNDIIQYLNYIQETLNLEIKEITAYMPISTKTPIIGILEDMLIRENIEMLLNLGLTPLINLNDFSNLKLLYKMIFRVDGDEGISKRFYNYSNTEIRKIVCNATSKSIIESLLQLEDQLIKIITNCFDNHQIFRDKLKSAFENSLNIQQNKMSILLEKYFHELLQKGFKKYKEEEIITRFERCISLLQLINTKDVFLAFYKNDLAKRLILNTTCSFELEKEAIVKLQKIIDSEEKQTYDRMFKDIQISNDMLIEFKQKIPKVDFPKFEAKIYILTQGLWPSYKPIPLVLPQYFLNLQNNFKKLYLSKHNGRRIHFQNSLCHCSLSWNLPINDKKRGNRKPKRGKKGKKKELLVSLIQTTILLKFNEDESYTLSQLKSVLQIDEIPLTRNLLALIQKKSPVLSLENSNSSISQSNLSINDIDFRFNPETVFKLNSDFSSKNRKVKVNSVQIIETKKEKKKIKQRVFQERKQALDACIVRIMKSTKSLDHKSLVSQIFHQIKIPLKQSEIKHRIESLISREYITRDDKDMQLYHYLA
ncbi:cullin-4b [Anaeramoeba flamelloides]|uniref:Cullin-4b n=1 Tax=Anaeramoeba flamelloides TaxID=1746091 RepID=A0ABQ8X7A0_9EUKA|nr:cullin-4b [Anaeramoeba flamelloides]